MRNEEGTLVKAAREALDRFDYEEALRLAEQALPSIAPGAVTERAQALLLAAQAASYSGGMREAAEYFSQAADAFHSLHDAHGLLRCRNGQARCAGRRGDLAHSMHLANDVLREARQRGFRDIEAEALSTLGTTCWRQGNAAAAITCLKQAVEMFTALKMHPEANYARGSLGVALVMAGQAEESAEVSKRALNYFRERGDLRSVAKILSNLGFTAYAQGEFETARSYLNRCTQLEAELKDRPLVMTTNYNLGLLELQEGHANAAKKPLTRAYHIAQETGDMTTEGAALMYLAVVALYEGLPDEATNYLALSQARYAGQPSDESQLVLHYLPVAVLAGGGVERALRLWSERPQLASYEACLDDLRNLSQLLTFLQTGGRSRGLALPAEALELAAQWKDEVEALLKQHTPAKAKSAER